MHRLALRGLVWMLALALVVSGLPMAHAMPDAPASQAADVMVHHHHDGMAMDAMSDTMSDVDGDNQPASTAPCKCLNCSMCVASVAVSPLRLVDPERRVAAVVYGVDPAGIRGIAVRVEPGIPILAV